MLYIGLAVLVVVLVVVFLNPHRRTRIRGVLLKQSIKRGRRQWGRKPPPSSHESRGTRGRGATGVVSKQRARIKAKIKRGHRSKYYTGDDSWQDLGTLWEGDI
jgi:hypothetical protein